MTREMMEQEWEVGSCRYPSHLNAGGKPGKLVQYADKEAAKRHRARLKVFAEYKRRQLQ